MRSCLKLYQHNRDVKYAMDMFKKYDADGSGKHSMLEASFCFFSSSSNLFSSVDMVHQGEIDKGEFRAIAKEIQADARRRNLISVAAAAIGAVSSW